MNPTTRDPASAGPWTRSDWAICLIAAVAVLLRWPNRARFLMTWDAHTFALALERYDVNGLRPHAPGYPLYVALGRVTAAVTADANDGYILLSLLLAATSVVLLYGFGRVLVGRRAAVAATAALLCAPLLHAHALTANVYTADLAASLAVAAAAWRTRQSPTRWRLALLALLFALAVGVRPSLGMFLLPLVIWASLAPPWDLRTQARRLVPALVVGPLVGLAWFLPMARLSGGIAAWRRANSLQSDVVYERPIWNDPTMLGINADRLARYLQWELRYVVPILAAALLLVLGRMLVKRHDGQASRAGSRPVFFALWALPALAFYLSVYSGYGNGPSGYALILLPPLFLATAALVDHLVQTLSPRAWPRLVAAGVLLVATLGPLGHLHDVADVEFRDHDGWSQAWSGLPDAFPPSNTSIVTAYNFAHVWYYYPDYHAYEYRPPGKAVGEVPDFLLIQHAHQHEATPDWYDTIADRVTAGPHPLQPGVENLILFDFQLAGENGGTRAVRDDVPVLEARLPNGWRVLYVEVEAGRPNLEDYFTMAGALPPRP